MRKQEFHKEIKEKGKGVDRIFWLCALVSNLLNQNTKDLKKSSDKIKQQKIKLDTDEKNSKNNKILR